MPYRSEDSSTPYLSTRKQSPTAQEHVRQIQIRPCDKDCGKAHWQSLEFTCELDIAALNAAGVYERLLLPFRFFARQTPLLFCNQWCCCEHNMKTSESHRHQL